MSRGKNVIMTMIVVKKIVNDIVYIHAILPIFFNDIAYIHFDSLTIEYHYICYFDIKMMEKREKFLPLTKTALFYT